MQHAVQGRSVRSAHLQDVDSAAARAVPLLDKPGPATGPYFPIEDVHVTQRTDGLRNANERAGAARGSGAPFWAVSSFWFICTRGAASGRLEQRGGRGVGDGVLLSSWRGCAVLQRDKGQGPAYHAAKARGVHPLACDWDAMKQG